MPDAGTQMRAASTPQGTSANGTAAAAAAHGPRGAGAVPPRPAGLAPIDPEVLGAAAEVLKILGHPLRLRIVEELERGERNVGELQAALGAEQAIVSQQLGRLRAAGIVEARRDGSRMVYQLRNARVPKVLDCIRGCRIEDFR